jgi:hypothetical protein
MTRRAALALVAAALLGGGAAAVVAAVHDGGGAPARPAAAPSAPGAKAAKPTPVDNRIQLSQAESLRLVGWARRFRTCMERRGVALGEPVAHPKEIDLAVEQGPAGAALARKTFACGDELGEPPHRSSLQLRPGKLVLYLPRQCLLDPKVTRAGTSS